MNKAIFGFLVAILASISSYAAIPSAKKTLALKPTPILRRAGSIRGGQAGTNFTILDVKTELAKNNRLERVKVSLGNGAFQNQNGSPGYFNVENRPAMKIVQIDLMQVLNSKVNEKAIRRIFAKSPFVKSSHLIFEPEGQTMSIILNLKKPVDVRVYPIKGTAKKTASLYIDLFEDSYVKRPQRAKAKAKTVRK
jgi:hypothetical protein